MKRILHYVGSMDYGGMEAVIMSLYRNIDRSVWQFDFAVHSEKKGYYEDEIERLGGSVFRFPMMRANPKLYKQVWDIFWKNHKDDYYVFQMHTNSLANIVALKASKKYGVPVRAIYAHSSYADKGRYQIIHDIIHKWNRKHITKYANVKFACSELAAKWLYGAADLQRDNVILMNNGIDYYRFRYNEGARIRIREQLAVEGKYVLCQVGHMLPVKNHFFTISLLKQLPDNIVCIFLGDGSLQDKIIKRVTDEGLQSRTFFLGMKPNVEDYLSASDAFLLPSLYEGMPLSVVEAQVSGLPCFISSNITKMAQVSNLVNYLDIKDVSVWGDIIKSQYDTNKSDRSKVVLDNKFDVKITAKKYIEIISNT